MKIGFRNTYANVAATAALVLTLGGTGYAATSMTSHDRAGSGSLPNSLAHHKTLRGAWGESFTNPASNDIQTDSISYPIHLKRNVKAVVRQEGAGSTHNCPGTPRSPQARPGFLCIYVAVGTNQATVHSYSPVDGNDVGNYKYGAVVYWRPTNPNTFTFASGTWAVTAK
jgi:hypothetical protein